MYWKTELRLINSIFVCVILNVIPTTKIIKICHFLTDVLIKKIYNVDTENNTLIFMKNFILKEQL